MLKLNTHYSNNFILIFITAFVVLSLFNYFTLRDNEIKSLKISLESQINLIKLKLDLNKNLQELSKNINIATKSRFTLIDKNGKVLTDSHFQNNKLMQNHQNRPEIKQSKINNFGYDKRISQTLHEEYLYVSSYDGKNEVYIRLSIKTKTIIENFLSIWIPMTLIFMFALLVCFFVIYYINYKIKYEIKNISNSLQAIENKDYNYQQKTSFAKEFQEILVLIQSLSQKLQKQNKKKRKYTAKLKLANKQQKTIIEAIGHEFKNPIATIMGYAQTIISEDDMKKDIQNKFLDKIYKNSKKISNMIDRLSFITKLENQDLDLKKVNFDLSLLVQEVVESFESRFIDRNFILKTKTCKIYADADMLEIIITNLIDNALKYSQNEIFIKVENQSFYIKDKGEGIKEDEIGKITNKFYRSKRFTWDNSIGLGLSIVTHILKLHDSNLEIKSEVGVGSSFYFYIP